MIDYEGLNKHRLETKNEILKMINENDRVAVVRPTGYGKSHLIAELCNELPGKKLILEPGKEVINYMEKFGIETINTDYDTYYSLLKPEMVELIIKFEQYDYIFLDEMHRALAEKWGNKLFNIFKALNMLNNKVKILGFSATPIRGDNKNVVEEMFHGIQVEPYYLADAILDNFLPIPNYHCGIYEIEDKDKRKMILKNEQLAKQILEYDIDASLSKMFKENLDFNKEHKIICFIDRVNSIKSAYNNIIKWFGTDINVFEVNHKQSKNKTQSIINEFILTKGINVLFCVNILNEGVHLPGVDCVIFLRKTNSNVIYNQQLGRVINTEIEEPIIFDLVNNADNPEWGYITMFEEKAEKQNKKITDLETKNKDKLKITLEQVDLIEKLKNINNNNKRILTKEDEEFIINNKDKYSIKEFTKMFNCDRHIISCIYKKYNIKDYKKEKNSLTEEQIQFIIENKDKYFIKEFAKIFNCDKQVINRIYKKYNIKDYKKDKVRLTKEQIQFIIENKDKYSMKEFAKISDCSISTINYIYKKYNIKDYKKESTISTEEQIQFIIKNKDNYSIKEFSEMFNCDRHAITYIYKKYNIKNYKKGDKTNLTKKQEQFIIKNKDKYLIKEFAKMFNCNRCTIISIYNRYNIKDYKRSFKKNYLTEEQIQFIIENKDKYFIKEFAKMFNYNRYVIDRIYKKYNIKDYKKESTILTEEQERFIIKNKDKYIIKEFSEMFSCDRHIITYIYKKHNIKDYKRERGYN